MSMNCYDDVNIGSGCVLSGSKQLSETILTQIYVAKWRH